ncbi:uncharacterized protein LOC133307667 [Gastrolobium bilobum]|uniref:uncharacterized protein LOC133307667 n=1 Tax=Gastrolobium bilobum TaxID=150636 RepID=UPI002AB15249|nr:uncharacterized protein LOC133307667 [Gastrolobium bilobum]
MDSSSGKHPTRHILLKDYLRDDLSSCSSSGFKSFPRRQCCTTVGFLLEKDIQSQRKRRDTIPRRQLWALQRASEAVINAIKSLPWSQQSAKATGLLSRSFSRKLLSRSFWRKAPKEDEGSKGAPRWRRSFRELLMQERDNPTLSSNEDTIFNAPNTTTSFSWGEIEFAFSSGATSSQSSTDYDLVTGTKETAPRVKIEGVTTSTRDWPKEKEQFSPVSVLDCPYEEEEEIKSHFNSTTHSFMEVTGAEHKHIQKRRHFKSVASLEPVVLEKRIALSELEDGPHNHSGTQCSVLVPNMCTQNGNRNVRQDNIEENARDLVNLVKRSIPSNSWKIKVAENLLFDYFKQSIGENNDIDHSKKLNICKIAEDWISGEPQELYLGWEVQEGRRVYIREMDKCKEWKNTDQGIQQLVLDLENEVLTSLVNELVLDLTKC